MDYTQSGRGSVFENINRPNPFDNTTIVSALVLFAYLERMSGLLYAGLL